MVSVEKNRRNDFLDTRREGTHRYMHIRVRRVTKREREMKEVTGLSILVRGGGGGRGGGGKRRRGRSFGRCLSKLLVPVKSEKPISMSLVPSGNPI